jgi:hypothetical protein
MVLNKFHNLTSRVLEISINLNRMAKVTKKVRTVEIKAMKRLEKEILTGSMKILGKRGIRIRILK